MVTLSVSRLLSSLLLGQLLGPPPSYTVNGGISCYECTWDQNHGCKQTGKVSKDYLKTNCSLCYKNVIPYKEGQAAAEGSRRCLQEADLTTAVGYTGKSECWMVDASLHCYCTENKCNHGETINCINYFILILTILAALTTARR